MCPTKLHLNTLAEHQLSTCIKPCSAMTGTSQQNS